MRLKKLYINMNFWEKSTIKRPVCAMLTENKIDIIFYSPVFII